MWLNSQLLVFIQIYDISNVFLCQVSSMSISEELRDIAVGEHEIAVRKARDIVCKDEVLCARSIQI
jgi:hypothetical protein